MPPVRLVPVAIPMPRSPDERQPKAWLGGVQPWPLVVNSKNGFLAAAFSAGGGTAVGGGAASHALAFAGRVIVGGAASVIGGGKFQNGAASAAFVYAVQSFAPDPSSSDSEPSSLGQEAPDAQEGIWFQFPKLVGLSVEDKVLVGVVKIFCVGGGDGLSYLDAARSFNRSYSNGYGINIDFQITSTASNATFSLKTGATISEFTLGRGGQLSQVAVRPFGFGSLKGSFQHELAHALGFGHRTMATNSIVSYSPQRRLVLDADEAKALVEQYK